jgi:GT2 family glycosyltransferase
MSDGGISLAKSKSNPIRILLETTLKPAVEILLKLVPVKTLTKAVNTRARGIDRPFGYKIQREILERSWFLQNKTKYSYIEDKFVIRWDEEKPNTDIRPTSVQIIVPTYNSSSDVIGLLSDINRELLSLSSSHRLIFDVLVSDDGSEVDEWNLIQQQAIDYGFEAIRNEKNQGFLKNVNSAYSKSKSDFALLINSDVRLPKEFLARILDHISNDAFGLLTIGSYEDFVALGAKSPNWLQLDRELRESGASYIEACTAVGYCLLISRSLAPTPLFDEDYGHGYGEDSDLHYQVSVAGTPSLLSLKMCVMHQGGKSYDQLDLVDYERSQGMNLFMKRWGKRYLLESEFFTPTVEAHLDRVTRRISQQGKQIVFAAQGLTSEAIGGIAVIRNSIVELAAGGVEFIVSDLNGNSESVIGGAVRATPKSNLIRHLDSSSISHLILGGNDGARYLQELKTGGISPDFVFVLLQGPDNLMDPGLTEIFVNSIATADVVFANSNYMARVGEFFGGRTIEQFTPNNEALGRKPKTRRSQGHKFDLCVSVRHEHGKAPWLSVAVANYFAKEGWSVAAFGNASKESPFELDENIITMGTLTPKKLHELLESSRVFFDSSLYEGYGILPRQAISAGCSVVAVENGGNETEAQKDTFELVKAWDLVTILEKVHSARQSVTKIIEPLNTQAKSLSQGVIFHLENPKEPHRRRQSN